DEENKIMDKCDLCADRRAEGLLPACVSACPTEALKFGEINEVLWDREGKIVANLKGSAEEGEGERALIVL
ncbi:4Fe-4S dicluster domain-containing protein, partial [Thermococcus sp.]|uniref:4Fe-4S dicluster domain-containing protein n=1 Tax=Thermococcus sp. TaxID=35749 RepID=UPI003441B4BD